MEWEKIIEAFGGSTTATTEDSVFTLDKLRQAMERIKGMEPIPLYKPPSMYRIIENEFLSSRIRFRFPRSKKKRIRRKWAKQEKNYRQEPMKDMYMMGDTLIAHPLIAKVLRNKISLEA